MKPADRLRPLLAGLRAAAVRVVITLLVATIAVAALAALAKARPTEAISALVSGAVGSPFAWTGTLQRAVPILLTGLAVAWAFRAGLFNIGAEGQLLFGAAAAAWVGFAWRLPAVIHLPVALLAGALAGALWAWPAAALKVRRGVPEVLSTLLLNFVAAHLVTYLANHPLHDPTQQGSRTPDVLPTAQLPLIPGTRLHVGLLLALAVAGLLAALLLRSRFGFQLRVVGRNAEAARTAGIDVPRVWTLTLLQSGALAGLAGAVEVLGVLRYFESHFSPGYGYEGIAVAILGANGPAGVVAAALFWGALANGAVEMESAVGVNRYLVAVIQALVILAVAVRRWPGSKG